jgi:MFS family permease
LRKLLALNFLNVLDAFIAGAYMITIPLLLVERNIDLTTIGVIFSAFPVVFLVSRMLFASAADSIGLKKFFKMDALGNLASIVLYGISSSPFSFTVAKGAQGIKEASLWAVNRNAAYEITSSEHPEMVTSTILFIRALAIAVGAIVSGFLIFWVGFHWLFALLAIISVLIFVPARKLDIGQKKKLNLGELLEKLDPRSVDHKIWRTSMVMSTYVAASTLAVGFVLPIFLLSTGLGYWEIGMIFAAYVGVGALLLPVTLRKVPSIRNTIFIQALLYFPAVLLIPLVGGNLMIVMVIMMALGESTSYIIWESLVSKAVGKCENLATSIGFLHVPSNLVLIPAYLLAGLLVDNFGYVPPFWMAGFLFLVYSIAAWQDLKADPES